MNVVFIGDSLTSGENNNFKSYAHYYSDNHPQDNISIFGVSGSCMGDYSIYPVKENMYDIVYHLIENSTLIHSADSIIFEYSINDTTAVAAEYANHNMVCISVVKTVDMIRQINPSVNIMFLLPFSLDNPSLDILGKLHVEYLNNDYFNNYPSYRISFNTWLDAYFKIVKFLQSSFKVIFFDQDNLYIDNLDKDNIHLNDAGYRKVAQYLNEYI